jgi:hypothetical protein
MKISKTNTIKKQNTIAINEEFYPYSVKSLDSKHRITLGGKLLKITSEKANAEAYQIFIGESGDILLRPTVSIPLNESWIYKNPEVINDLRKGFQDAKNNKTEKINDITAFLDDL